MRKLKRPKPTKRYISSKAKWLEDFLNRGSSPWTYKSIKEPFLEASHYKCAYCETKLYDKKTGKNENVWANIDHFYPKEKYKQKALDWDNFLPSCSMCNSMKKNKFDLDKNGNRIMVNPFEDNTQELFAYDDGLLSGLNYNAKYTLLALSFIDRNLIHEYYKTINDPLQMQLEKLEEYVSKIDEPLSRVEFIRKLKKYLSNGSNEKAFSTYCATYIYRKKHSIEFLEELRKNKNIWDEEMEMLFQECARNSFTLK